MSRIRQSMGLQEWHLNMAATVGLHFRSTTTAGVHRALHYKAYETYVSSLGSNPLAFLP